MLVQVPAPHHHLVCISFKTCINELIFFSRSRTTGSTRRSKWNCFISQFLTKNVQGTRLRVDELSEIIHNNDIIDDNEQHIRTTQKYVCISFKRDCLLTYNNQD